MARNDRSHPIPTPDGGWGWAVVVGSFVCMYMSFGFPRVLGLFITLLVDDFESTTGRMGAIVSMPITILMVTGPFAGALCKTYGCRHIGMFGGVLVATGLGIAYFSTNEFTLAIGLGILPGLGLGLAFNASVVITSRYFKSMYIIANGIMYLGVPVSFLFSPILTQNLLVMFGWRGSILIWSAITLNVAVGGVLMRPVYLIRDGEDNLNEYELLDAEQMSSNENRSDTASSENRISKLLHSLVKVLELRLFYENRMFLLLMAVIFLNGFAYEAWLIYVVPQANELNIPDEMSAIILSTTGIGSIAGRLLQMGMLHWKILSPYNLLRIATVIAALALIMDPIFQNFGGLLSFSVAYGISTGIVMPLGPVLIRDYIGFDKIPVAFGWYNLSRGTGALLGGISIGVLYDHYGGYRIPFVLVAVVQSAALVILALKPATADNSVPSQ